MRNLKISVLDVEHHSILREYVSFSVNTNNENVYFVKDDSVVILSSDFGENSNLTHIPIDPSIEGNIISAQYLYESNVLCIGTSTGDLTTICETTHQVECVGNVPCGLKAIAWSPDEDLLALITGEDNLILMTKDFDPLLEKYLHPDDFGENKPVTAGWGSKETQFHGSEGKGARNVKLVVEPAHAWDDRLPVVTWRGDGQLFAVSTVHPQKEFRQIRIWDREGTLLCTSEDVNGLESSINWRPSGSVIAGIQRLPNVHQVVFFEKNGLRHREFQLPFQPMEFEVKGLSWNSDSTILAVWGRNLHSEDSNPGWKVMIWTTSNYHWFLKQSMDLKNEEVSCLMWDVISPYVLRLFSSRTGLFLKYSFCWNTDRSIQPVGCKTDPAFVCVADGSSLNVTPFGKMIIPPPLCAYSFILPTPVSQVVFGHSKHSSDIIAVLTDNRLARFSYNNGDSELEKEDVNEKQECSVKLGMIGANGGRTVFRPHQFKTIAKVKWEKQMSAADIPGAAHHWLWVKEDVLVCSLPDDNCCGDSLFSVELKKEADQKELVGKFCCQLSQPIISMCVLHGETIVIQLTNGLVFKYNLDDSVLIPWELSSGSQLKIPQPSPYMCACKIGAQDHLLSLSTRNRLFCGNKELLNNCTSFTLHNEFLLLTTHSHTLRCLHLKYDLPKQLEGQPLVAVDESPRSVERGSQLITSSSSETRVVLQMPRGNLEAVHPRTLLLYTVSKLLDKLNFREAFELMRKHRINLNLLYDHNPEVFMKNAEVFVKDVNNPDHINLFLAELTADDVTRKMYSSVYRKNPSKLEAVEECKLSKVDSICDKLKTALQDVDPKKFFLSIITTHAKKTTSELDVALQKVKELRDSDPEWQSVAAGALEHLLYMVDVNQLYDIALGTYDFDTVLMVAEKSQKDPKEYLQFLNGLKALETNYQKYKIDMHLRRYKKALVHIANCGESHFEECVQLVQSQKLYRDALRIFPTGTPQNKKIWEKYGDYLVSKRQLEEAGLAFQCAGHWESALSAHQGALVWEMALYDAEQLSYGPLQMSQLAKSLAESLKANGRHSESANLLEQYAQDEEECIATLVEGQLWNAALLKISKYRRSDLLETHLKPALLENSSEMLSNIEQMSEDFTEKVQRLRKVRENRSKAEMEFPDDELLFHSQADAFSDVSSVAALSQNSASNTVLSGSINTRRTGRNRQKQELKKYSLKEGSQFEDLALISALSQLVRAADDLRDPCSSILKTLVFFHFDQEAGLLQKKMQSFYSLIEDNLSIIWPPEDSQTAKPVIELGPTATSNLIAASMQEQQQRRQVISDPSLRIPPKFKKDAEWKLFVLGNTI